MKPRQTIQPFDESQIGHDLIVVLGHPAYYPCFGFTPAKRKGLRREYDVPEEVFMVVELKPGTLRGRQGLVKYGREFKRCLIRKPPPVEPLSKATRSHI